MAPRRRSHRRTGHWPAELPPVPAVADNGTVCGPSLLGSAATGDGHGRSSSGTVTLTDIAGSTALWERDRQVMAEAVERHIAVLDAAIQTHGGVRSKTVSVMPSVGFPTAPAVFCCS